MHHTFLSFVLVFSSFWFAFHFAEIHNTIVNGAYPNSIAIPCANLTHFHALILLNRREIDKQYLHCLYAVLTLVKLNINQACLDTFH